MRARARIAWTTQSKERHKFQSAHRAHDTVADTPNDRPTDRVQVFHAMHLNLLFCAINHVHDSEYVCPFIRAFVFFFGGFSCNSWLRPKQAETTINFQRMNEMWIKCKQRKCLMWTPNATQTRSNNNKNCWIFIFNWRMKRWKKKRNNRNQLEFTDSTWFIYCRRFLPRNRFRTFFFMSLSNQNNKCFGCVLLAESLFRRHNMKEKKVKLILESSEWHFFSLSSFWRRTHFVKQVLDLGIDKVALVSVLNSTSSELLSCSRKSRMKSSHSFNCSKSNSIATEVTQF